jgi:hypothetical protein
LSGTDASEHAQVKNQIIALYLAENKKASAAKTMGFFGTTDETLGALFEMLDDLSGRTDVLISKNDLEAHYKTLGDYCFKKGLYANAIQFYGKLSRDQYAQKINIAKFKNSFKVLREPFNDILRINNSQTATIKKNIQDLHTQVDALLDSHGSSKENCLEIKHVLEETDKILKSLKSLKNLEIQRHWDIEIALEKLSFDLVDKLVKTVYTNGLPLAYSLKRDTLSPEHRTTYLNKIVNTDYPGNFAEHTNQYNKALVLSHVATLYATDIPTFIPRIESVIKEFGFNPEQELDSMKFILNKTCATPDEAIARLKLIDACLCNWKQLNTSAPNNDDNARQLLEIASSLAETFQDNPTVKEQTESLLKKFPQARPKNATKPLFFTNKDTAHNNPAASPKGSAASTVSNAASSSSSSQSKPVAPLKDTSRAHLNSFIQYFLTKGKAAYNGGYPDNDAKERSNTRAERLIKILTRLKSIHNEAGDDETKKQQFLGEFKKFQKTPMDLKIHSEGMNPASKLLREMQKSTMKLGDFIDRKTEAQTDHDYHKDQLNGEELWEMMQNNPADIDKYIASFQSFVDWDMKQKDFSRFEKEYEAKYNADGPASSARPTAH